MVAPSRAPPGSSSVRRNLFNSTHSRRATSQSSADTVQLAISEDQPETQPWDNGILVRDAEGNIVYDDPIPEPDRDEQPDSRDPFSEEEKEKNDAIRKLFSLSFGPSLFGHIPNYLRRVGEAAGILELYRSQTRKSVGENQKGTWFLPR